jgi:hypothetical protein
MLLVAISWKKHLSQVSIIGDFFAVIEADFCVLALLHFHPNLFVPNMGLAVGHCGQAHVKKRRYPYLYLNHERKISQKRYQNKVGFTGRLLIFCGCTGKRFMV